MAHPSSNTSVANRSPWAGRSRATTVATMLTSPAIAMAKDAVRTESMKNAPCRVAGATVLAGRRNSNRTLSVTESTIVVDSRNWLSSKYSPMTP